MIRKIWEIGAQSSIYIIVTTSYVYCLYNLANFTAFPV